MTGQLDDNYEVLVIGGGAAGLSGALTLARSLRSVAVIDAGAPRNAPAEGVHGLLARDGMRPDELLGRGRAEVRRYGGHVVPGEVATAVRAGDGFEVTLTDGRSAHARRLLVTTGLVDRLPDIPGLRERWGRDVLHCPYCHGYEVRGQAIGVLATGPTAMHQVLLFRQLTDDVTLFTHTQPPLDETDAERLAARGVRVVPGTVTGVETTDDRLSGIRLDDGTVVPRQALAVATRLEARAAFLDSLGLHTAEHPMGTYVPADTTGRTDVPGVWVAGNVTDPMAQVGAAGAAGTTAGAQINADLAAEDTDRAVAAHRESRRGGHPASHRDGPAPADADGVSDGQTADGTDGQTAAVADGQVAAGADGQAAAGTEGRAA